MNCVSCLNVGIVSENNLRWAESIKIYESGML